MVEIPIVIKNSYLMNTLLLELQEQLPLDKGGVQFLDLGTSGTLETQLRVMMDNVDEENQARAARDEDPLPEEEINKVFKTLPPPSRINPLILSGTISNTADEVSEFCSQSLAKLFITEPLQIAKQSSAPTQ